jgi:PAS domain S-box-containing protein
VNVSPDIADHAPRILIVDDERMNRQLLAVMLAPEGFQLLTASSGEEALAMVAKQQPDVILLDVMMPGTDGYRVAGQIKANLDTKNIPIIMITALNNRDARMQALSAGAEDFLTKPVDRAELCMRVRNLSRLKNYGDYYEQQAAVLAEQAALLDLAQDAILAMDLECRILFWNRGAEAMYGWPSAEVLGSNARDLLHAEFSEPTGQIQATLLRDGRWEGEAVHRRRDGRNLIVASRWALQRDDHGAPVRILSITNDITERKEEEAERISLTERLSLATAVAEVGVWEWEVASNKLTWDATMFHIYGLPPVVSMPYRTWSAAVHPDDLPVLEADLQKMIDQKTQGSAGYRIILANGSERHISAVMGVVLDVSGNVNRVIGVNMDITARKEVDRIKSEFIATVSHELRTPLTSIRGSLGLVAGGAAGTLPEKAAHLIEVAYSNAGRLTLIINDILDVEKIDCGKMTLELADHSLAALVEQAVEENLGFAQSYRVRFVLPMPLPDVTVNVDAGRTLQVLANILSNAVKFSPAEASVDIGMAVDGVNVRVTVTDHGPGIPTSFRHRIFERFSQADGSDSRQKGGTGLGLTISKALIEQMGGTIGYESNAGVATTFFFELPLALKDRSAKPPTGAVQPPAISAVAGPMV